MDSAKEDPQKKLSPWLASLPGLLDAANTIDDIAKLTRTPEVETALGTTGVSAAMEAVSTTAAEGEKLILGVSVVYDGRYHRQEELILVLTSAAVYRVELPKNDAAPSVRARVALTSIISVEGAAYGWLMGT